MSFGDAVRDGFDHYTNFQGRASRAAFWWWFLFGIIVSAVSWIIGDAIDFLAIYYIAGLALLLPNISVAIRRLHDTGRSGWWILIGLIPIIGFIVLLIFYLEQGDQAANEYGPPPADAAPAPAA